MLESKNFLFHAEAQRRKELQKIYLFSRVNLCKMSINLNGLILLVAIPQSLIEYDYRIANYSCHSVWL